SPSPGTDWRASSRITCPPGGGRDPCRSGSRRRGGYPHSRLYGDTAAGPTVSCLNRHVTCDCPPCVSFWRMCGMRQRWLGLGLTLGFLACAYGDSVAGLTAQYIAEGVAAMVQYDQAAARLRALQGAFREALEPAVAGMVDTNAVVSRNRQAIRASIDAKPLQSIVSYRVLWKSPDPPQKVYRVGVEAEIPVGELSRALDAIGLTRRREDMRIVIFMAERYPGQTLQTFAAS